MDQNNYPQDTWSTQAQAGCGYCQNGQGGHTIQDNVSAQRTQDWLSENITLRVADSSADAAASQQCYGNEAAGCISQFTYSFNHTGN